MLHDYEMDDRYDEVKEWYDGYRIREKQMCTVQWDVVNYCNDHIHNPEAEPENYWMNTSGNSVIHHLSTASNEPDMLTKNRTGMAGKWKNSDQTNRRNGYLQ